MKKLLAIIALASFITTFASEQKTIPLVKEEKNTSAEIQKLDAQFEQSVKDRFRILQELYDLAEKSESEQIRNLAQEINPIYKKAFGDWFTRRASLVQTRRASSDFTEEMFQLRDKYHSLNNKLLPIIKTQGNANLKNKLDEIDAKDKEIEKIGNDMWNLKKLELRGN